MKWCDYSCEHAAFPEEALEGACRTVAAVWCKALKKLVPKNSPCQLPPTKGEAKRRRKQR